MRARVLLIVTILVLVVATVAVLYAGGCRSRMLREGDGSRVGKGAPAAGAFEGREGNAGRQQQRHAPRTDEEDDRLHPQGGTASSEQKPPSESLVTIHVANEQGERIEEAEVFLREGSQWTMLGSTDRGGALQVMLDPGGHSLTIRAHGYRTEEFRADVSEGGGRRTGAHVRPRAGWEDLGPRRLPQRRVGGRGDHGRRLP